MFVIEERGRYGRGYGLGFWGWACWEVWQGKLRLAVTSNQTKLRVSAIFNVSMSVEKWLLNGYLLKVAANCVILWNQKLRCGTFFLYKNKMKRRILQACSLKHSIIKTWCLLRAKWTYLGRAGESYPTPTPPPTWLRACSIIAVNKFLSKLLRI